MTRSIKRTALALFVCTLVMAVGSSIRAEETPCPILFMSEVNEDSMIKLLSDIGDNGICKQTARIKLTVQSGGGLIDPALYTVEQIRLRSVNLDTYIGYNADSAAILLFLSGKERVMHPKAEMLLHEIRLPVQGEMTEHDLREAYEDMVRAKRNYAEYVAMRTGLEASVVLEMMQARTRINATDAVKLGFATSIDTVVTQ